MFDPLLSEQKLYELQELINRINPNQNEEKGVNTSDEEEGLEEVDYIEPYDTAEQDIANVPTAFSLTDYNREIYDQLVAFLHDITEESSTFNNNKNEYLELLKTLIADREILSSLQEDEFRLLLLTACSLYDHSEFAYESYEYFITDLLKDERFLEFLRDPEDLSLLIRFAENIAFLRNQTPGTLSYLIMFANKVEEYGDYAPITKFKKMLRACAQAMAENSSADEEKILVNFVKDLQHLEIDTLSVESSGNKSLDNKPLDSESSDDESLVSEFGVDFCSLYRQVIISITKGLYTKANNKSSGLENINDSTFNDVVAEYIYDEYCTWIEEQSINSFIVFIKALLNVSDKMREEDLTSFVESLKIYSLNSLFEGVSNYSTKQEYQVLNSLLEMLQDSDNMSIIALYEGCIDVLSIQYYLTPQDIKLSSEGQTTLLHFFTKKTQAKRALPEQDQDQDQDQTVETPNKRLRNA